MKDKTFTTIACRSGHHLYCPGWFREDVLQPWSNQVCACHCHAKEVSTDEQRRSYVPVRGTAERA